MSEDFYESKIPKMIVCNAFGVACNGRVAKYGVPGNSSSYFADWKDMSVDMTPGKRTHRGGVLLGCQSQDRQIARPDIAADSTRPRRRGDRVADVDARLDLGRTAAE